MKKLFYLFAICLAATGFGSCDDSTASDVVVPGGGIGGSMAQFTVHKGHLYTLQGGKLKTLSLLNPAAPEPVHVQEVGEDAETVFPYRDELYLGTQNGVHIFSLTAPDKPSYVSTYEHFTACDPVVVEGEIAYSTLRQGNCRGFVNELHIVDVADPFNPQELFILPMEDPHGLAVKDGMLYVCEGDKGLKVIDARNPESPQVVSAYGSFHGYDAILTPKSLMVVGEDGLAQYDYTDPYNLELLSFIPVNQAL